MPHTAVLLVNLGTPEAPTPSAVRRYLTQFLSDPRVISMPRWLWPLILRLILPFRTRASAAKYASIWLSEGSPLRVYTLQQVNALKKQLAVSGCDWMIEYAMRYGEPSISLVLQQLKRMDIKRILLVPMYPQYSTSTTGSVWDITLTELKRMHAPPEIRMIEPYADFPPYIAALTAHVREYWVVHGQPDFAAGDRFLLSFHGLPQRMVDLGDPYYGQCQTTAKLLARALGLAETEYHIAFQSRFGPAQWLQPDTLPTLKAWGRAGVRRVDVFCPGFTADCLETLHEIGIEARLTFLHAGGSEYHRIPCVNAVRPFIDCLIELITLRS